MSEYAATARLQGAPVRGGRALDPTTSAARDLARGSGSLDADASLEAGAPEPSLEDRLYYLRQAWSQTTFYLFDPQSWR